ncbi:hypothetical protein HPB50_020666 [Hyalomma asiaticum]|uniref:Uncharacterized protein n=3 Tax=Hyalomma asiaticum TaxID=266040 RepID=A0ACB7S3J2_HYAAI|nr:hypothetical protein HPB50_005195 [Hyalomma asiaticum]KAH6930420.1 hypothetical protein HPB50_013460 [Hyalomma asiaticum]KAH6934128.1 hypothetical protein HPB50_020666 [Hyalomma asiaticum]
MSGSARAVSAAASGRGSRYSIAPPGYQYVLPTLPSGETMKECLFLHCDVAGRPYRLEDFRDPLQELGVLKDVTGIGPFQMTHVWLIKLRTREIKEVLLNAGGIEVKGRFCAVIDPVQQDITLKVHWVPFHVTGEALKKAFDHYGEVKEVRQDEWKVRGFEQAESTTRIVRMTLREDLTPDELPHLFRIFGGSVLVVVPGRAPICLRCRRKGHIRRDCRVPRCVQCREFGHELKDCVRTYARVTGSRQHEEEGLELMEEEVNDKVTASLETQAEQGAKDAEKAATPAASTKDDSTSRKQKQRKTKGEVRTESAPERLDQECDAMKEVMDAESETPYETPDETVTEEPATPAKRSRSDETDEETLEGSVQRLEPHWMVVRSTRTKKGKHVPAQRSASLTREGQAAMQ